MSGTAAQPQLISERIRQSVQAVLNLRYSGRHHCSMLTAGETV